MATYEETYNKVLARVTEELDGYVSPIILANLGAYPMTATLAVLAERGRVYEQEIMTADPDVLLTLTDRFPELAEELPELPRDKQEMCARVLKFMYEFAVEFVHGKKE